MRKYVGKFRVQCERDIYGDPSGEDYTFLTGTGNYLGYEIHRHSENELKLLCMGVSSVIVSNMVSKFDKFKVPITKKTDCGAEGWIHFEEKYLDTVAEMIGAKTNGAKISPESIKNHPNYKEIKQERYDNMTDEQKESLRLRGEKLKQHRINGVKA